MNEVAVKRWLRRIRAALGMGVTWAVGWGLVGFGIELIQEIVPGWNGAIVDIWPTALALPAFIGGVAFSGVLGIAGRRRRLDEMSLPRFAGWGALGGLLVSLPLVALMGLTFPSLVVTGVVTALCSSSAVGSLMLARIAEDRELLSASGDVAEVGLTADEAKELLGGRG